VHSLAEAAELLAGQLGIAPDEARSRLQLIADNIGISGTELAELVLYRDTLVD
jgi:hypothetical protein